MDSSWIITGGIITLMLILIFLTPKRARRGDRLPSIIASLGILGTFIGIFFGLLGFDVNNIQNSIPQLLGGLKIAFLTSIAGMILALVLRYFDNRKSSNKAGIQKTGATIDTLAELLNNQNRIIDDHLKRIDKSLVGEGDSTLITQIQKLRTTVIDQNEILQRSIQGSLEKLDHNLEDNADKIFNEIHGLTDTFKENFTAALFTALESAITDFNDKISKQFGENFKQLNIAIGRLLEWQEKYQEQLQILINKMDANLLLLTAVSDDFKTISDQMQTVMELVDELDGLIETSKVHLRHLQQAIEAHADIADKAKNAFPIIEDNIKKLTEDFSDAVHDAISSNQKSNKDFRKAVEEQSAFFQEYAKSMRDDIGKIMNGIDIKLHELMKKNSSIIQKQVEELDKNLQDELSKSLRTLGDQLVSLSGKFVEDYTPLTDRLKEIVEIAKNGDHDNE